MPSWSVRICTCGSGLESHWEYDARGIELCRVCPKCKAEKLSHYRHDVLVVTDQEFRSLGWGNIERNLDVDEEASADAIYNEAYTLAFDAMHDAGCELHKARSIAQEIAQCFAQP